MKPPLTLEALRALSGDEIPAYCAALRRALVENVTQTGGHLASNLGIVEISVALARQMNLPEEKVIYDTGHQAYVHKMLTGRGARLSTLRQRGGLSGFPLREESEFDAFGTGHSGTGLSAALGFAAAGRLAGKKDFTAVVIGDGSFTGGMVFEALNNISPRDRVIIILNDNGMSIGKSVGQLKSALNQLRTAGYYRLKDEVQSALQSVPVLGKNLAEAARAVKNTVKRSALPMGNLFEQLGLHYFGPADGNCVETVENLIRQAKKRQGPSLIHLCTQKGKGYAPAQSDPSSYHGISPKGAAKGGKGFSRLMGETLCRLAEEDERIVAITAAMGDGVGLSLFREKYPHRYFDVGIAEEHAMTFAAGLAAAGKKPVFAVYSTFYQRSVDQLLHDAALQKLPVVICLDRAGIVGEDGATHQGLFDLPLTLPIPGVRILAPLNEREMEIALREALAETERPTVIRYPKGSPEFSDKKRFFGEEIQSFSFGNGAPSLTVATFGRMTDRVLEAAEELSREGLSIRVVRHFTLKGFDPDLLSEHYSDTCRLLTVEEGCLTGGFSSYLVSLLSERGLSPKEGHRSLGILETFVSHGKTEALLEEMGLGKESIKKEMKHFATLGSVLD